MSSRTTNRVHPDRIAIAYLLLQGLLVGGFWIVMAAAPGLQDHFVTQNAPWRTFRTFMLPDILLLAALPLATAWAWHARKRWTRYALWLNTGAAAYATLSAISLWLADGHLWMGALMMAPMLIFPGWVACMASREDEQA